MSSKILVAIFLSLIFLIQPRSKVQAQVAVINYLKIAPEKAGDYLQLENQWKVVHEARLRNKAIISWGLYEVMFTGSADLYNYALVTIYENLDMYDRSWDINFLTEAFPGMANSEIDAFYQQTERIKNVVRVVVVKRLLSTSTETVELPAYVLVNRMKVIPGEESEYLEMEKNIFMPIHEEGIRQKARAGWALWEKSYGGDFDEFQYITLDEYYSFQQIENDNTLPLFATLNPNKNFDQVLEKISRIRRIVSREAWRLLEFVE